MAAHTCEWSQKQSCPWLRAAAQHPLLSCGMCGSRAAEPLCTRENETSLAARQERTTEMFAPQPLLRSSL